MIKAVAAALVLIAGAAVVLWFGNTLNSWVLGGLIGGLAALLLSIPISLTLFSYLSHRHDEQLRAEAELAEAEFSQMYEYEQIPGRSARSMYSVEEYVDPDAGEFGMRRKNTINNHASKCAAFRLLLHNVLQNNVPLPTGRPFHAVVMSLCPNLGQEMCPLLVIRMLVAVVLPRAN